MVIKFENDYEICLYLFLIVFFQNQKPFLNISNNKCKWIFTRYSRQLERLLFAVHRVWRCECECTNQIDNRQSIQYPKMCSVIIVIHLFNTHSKALTRRHKYMHVHTYTRTRTYTHTHTHTNARTHTHIRNYNRHTFHHWNTNHTPSTYH